MSSKRSKRKLSLLTTFDNDSKRLKSQNLNVKRSFTQEKWKFKLLLRASSEFFKVFFTLAEINLCKDLYETLDDTFEAFKIFLWACIDRRSFNKAKQKDELLKGKNIVFKTSLLSKSESFVVFVCCDDTIHLFC
jgi:hypothetical protein